MSNIEDLQRMLTSRSTDYGKMRQILASFLMRNQCVIEDLRRRVKDAKVKQKEKIEDIPKVRVRDPDTGKILAEGYYFEMPETCYAMHVPGETPIRTVRSVVSWEMTDWGLPNRIRIREVTPPHKIEVVNKGEIND